MDWNVPFSYQDDGLFNSLLVKGIKDNAWALHNAFLGAPGQQVLHDFPKIYTAQFLGLKLLTWFSSNYAEAMNLYYLLTYPVIMMVSWAVFVSLGLSRPAAFLSSGLFTFLPFHYARGETHLLLAAYVSVPLAAWLIVRVHGAPLFGPRRSPGGEESAAAEEAGARRKRRWRLAGILALALLVASSGIYYAYFAIVLLLISGSVAWLWDRRRSSVAAALVLSAGITLGIAGHLVPSFVYWHHHGRNPEVANRRTGEAETYGLKLTQLLLPATGHRVPALAALKARYCMHAPTVTEDDDATLGFFGSCGFLLLTGLLLAGPRSDRFPRWLRIFAVSSLAAFLLGTVGGFGSLVSLAGFSEIRAYTRLCVFIAFFALGAVGFLVDRILLHPRLARSRALPASLVVALLGVGLYDQTPTTACPDYEKLKDDFRGDETFVQGVEQRLPAGAMIFQMPYMAFPEAPGPIDMGGYGLARGYLHSRTLRWSYGAMRGRQDDQWQRKTANFPVTTLVAELRKVGFSGIYLDRSGYRDGGTSVEAQLREVLGQPSLVSDARKLAFYPIAP